MDRFPHYLSLIIAHIYINKTLYVTFCLRPVSYTADTFFMELLTNFQNLDPVKYECIVYTGDVNFCGTNANVSVEFWGTNGSSGKLALQQKGRDLFERKQMDKFPLEIIDLGKIHNLLRCIIHTCTCICSTQVYTQRVSH